jgi:hypothetical protein
VDVTCIKLKQTSIDVVHTQLVLRKHDDSGTMFVFFKKENTPQLYLKKASNNSPLSSVFLFAGMCYVRSR